MIIYLSKNTDISLYSSHLHLSCSDTLIKCCYNC